MIHVRIYACISHGFPASAHWNTLRAYACTEYIVTWTLMDIFVDICSICIYIFLHAELVKFNLIDICACTTGFCYTWLWYFDIFEQFVLWFPHMNHVFLSNLLAYDNSTPCACAEGVGLYFHGNWVFNE